MTTTGPWTEFLKTLPDPTETIVSITLQGQNKLVATQRHLFLLDTNNNITEVQVTWSS